MYLRLWQLLAHFHPVFVFVVNARCTTEDAAATANGGNAELHHQITIFLFGEVNCVYRTKGEINGNQDATLADLNLFLITVCVEKRKRIIYFFCLTLFSLCRPRVSFIYSILRAFDDKSDSSLEEI
jgi:hypothetical protein